jgi:DNA-binding CsgD family transcriptional regulator
MEYKMAGFTGYQLWVAAMLASGSSTREIADKRGVKIRSVSFEIAQIYAKTGFSTFGEIITWAKDNALDDPSILEVPARRRRDPKMKAFFKA